MNEWQNLEGFLINSCWQLSVLQSIHSGTVKYRQLNMVLYSTVALHTFTMEQVYSYGIIYIYTHDCHTL